MADGVLKKGVDSGALTLQMIKNMKEKNKNLHQTRDLLLPKLISGELDISELEIDTGKEAA